MNPKTEFGTEIQIIYIGASVSIQLSQRIQNPTKSVDPGPFQSFRDPLRELTYPRLRVRVLGIVKGPGMTGKKS
eukprot:15325057-Ditylum_brightwellii.AAC.1